MKNYTTISIASGVGFGVLWHAWDVHGFLWGLVYGVFWQSWFGYRVALYFLGN